MLKSNSDGDSGTVKCDVKGCEESIGQQKWLKSSGWMQYHTIIDDGISRWVDYCPTCNRKYIDQRSGLGAIG